MKVNRPSTNSVGSTMRANTAKVWSFPGGCLRKPSATKVLETEKMNIDAREADSLAA